MSNPIRIGLIGAGAVVQVAHLPVLKKLKNVELTAICDVDVPKARALAERFGIRDVFDDIEDLLGHVEVDALLIATPNHLHEDHIQAALRSNAHVLVEKPLSVTSAGAQRIARAAEKRGKVVMAGMTHRYRPDAQAVRSFVQSGELGEIDSVRSSWHVARFARAALGWRQRKDEAGGGAMLDLGLTMLDLCFWLCGNPTPVRVSAALTKPRGERGVEQSGSAYVVCENGAAIFVDVTWRHIGEGERFGVGLRGSKGSAGINPLHVWKELNGMPHDVSPTGSFSRENSFTASFRAQWA
ncbi:MAG TPA: Gfo/Idh/MocA family oxidoreductase, partial [Gemmatimonadales bacterium]|nr:Gfo/Idh/MocA family oxidoreductase [Gemmatimonadales bacterium]